MNLTALYRRQPALQVQSLLQLGLHEATKNKSETPMKKSNNPLVMAGSGGILSMKRQDCVRISCSGPNLLAGNTGPDEDAAGKTWR